MIDTRAPATGALDVAANGDHRPDAEAKRKRSRPGKRERAAAGRQAQLDAIVMGRGGAHVENAQLVPECPGRVGVGNALHFNFGGGPTA